MSHRHATRQFFKDGLPGAIIAALIYLPLWLFMPSEGIFFVAAIFISTGFNTHFIKKQTIQARKDWAKPILKMLGTAWLVTLLTTLLYCVFTPIINSLLKLAQHHNFHHSFSLAFWNIYDAVAEGFSLFFHEATVGLYLFFFWIIIYSILGLLIGFIIAYLVAIISYPQKLVMIRLFMPVITSFSVPILTYLVYATIGDILYFISLGFNKI